MSIPTIDPYLTFDGNCAEAMRFYERTLGGTLEVLMKASESPDPAMRPTPGAEGAARDPILHASLLLGQQRIMASDSMGGMAYAGMRGISITLGYDSAEEARRVFDALAEGGRVEMPLTETFWAQAFGSVVDRYGTPWLVNGGAKDFEP